MASVANVRRRRKIGIGIIRWLAHGARDGDRGLHLRGKDSNVFLFATNAHLSLVASRRLEHALVTAHRMRGEVQTRAIRRGGSDHRASLTRTQHRAYRRGGF